MVGSIDTSEFVVAVGGSIGFLLALGSAGIRWDIAAALLIGGCIAAPFAAWLVKHLPARVLGVAAGGLIVLTNTKTMAETFGASGSVVGRHRRGRRRALDLRHRLGGQAGAALQGPPRGGTRRAAGRGLTCWGTAF